MLVAFEGLDRAGKTTQTHLVSEALTKQKIKNIIFRFPDRETEIGKIINKYLKEEYESDPYVMHLLFSANRYECMKKINKYIDDNYIVILDRYFYSGIVYSIANNIEDKWCYETEKLLRTPDIIFYFNTFFKKDCNERYENERFQNKIKKIFDEVLCNATKIDSSMSIYDITNFIKSKIFNLIDNKDNFTLESIENNDSESDDHAVNL